MADMNEGHNVEQTIDDIFTREHYKRADCFIRVAHPVVRKLETDEAFMHQSFANETKEDSIPEGTQYFGFFDPSNPKMYYFIFSPNDKAYGDEIEKIIEDLHKSEKRELTDIIALRKINKEKGLFENPRYLDVRDLFKDGGKHVIYSIVPESFTDFPSDEIISGLESQKRNTYVFHDNKSGFAIETSDGEMNVISENSLIKKADEETRDIEEPSKRLETFLEQLTRNQFYIEPIGYFDPDGILNEPIFSSKRLKLNEESQQMKLVYAILSHNGSALNVRASMTGEIISKIKNVEGETYIESTSPRFEEIIKHREESFERFNREYEATLKSEVLKFMVPQMKAARDKYLPGNKKGVITTLLEETKCPVIEEEIPGARIYGHEIKFKVICQHVSNGEENFTLTGYTKLSNGEIGTNVPIGESYENISDILQLLYTKNLSGGSGESISTLVSKKSEELLDKAYGFANTFYEHCGSKLFLEIIEGQLRGKRLRLSSTIQDFEIEIIPAWNEERKEIDLYFLGLNAAYEHDGLRQLNPDSAKLVEKNKKRISDSYK